MKKSTNSILSDEKTNEAIAPNIGYAMVRGVKYERKMKAYCIDLSRIFHGYQFSDTVCFAKNHNSAKSTLLKIALNEGMGLDSHVESEITYLNIPVVRKKQSDRFLFEDKIISLSEIESILSERDRQKVLDEIIENPKIEYCYIKKGSYYRPGYAGYTEYKKFAGVYPKKDAVSHARGVCEITIIPIDVIEHNEMINSEIANLKTRLL